MRLDHVQRGKTKKLVGRGSFAVANDLTANNDDTAIDTGTATPHDAAINLVELNKIYIADKSSKTSFLIDTGADVSVVPPMQRSNIKPSGIKLYAANGTPINTFGERTIKLDLGLRRCFHWSFIVADVKQPIIGSDFLAHFDLLVDVKRHAIVDKTTSLQSTGQQHRAPDTIIKTFNVMDPVAELLNEYKDVTQTSSNLRVTSGVAHHIVTHGPPVTSKARRLSPEMYKIAKDEFEYMLKNGICRPSSSQYASPLHMVKKADGSYRPCGDYRSLNAVTVRDSYSLPYPHDCANILQGKKLFSKVDALKAFNQIPVAEEDIHKTAVITPFGLYEFNYMGFGLCGASQTFQRYVDHHFRDMPFVFAFIDDFLIASDNEDEHRTHLRQFFERLRTAGLRINVAKSTFFRSEVDFLGYRITPNGMQPLSSRVAAIISFPKPIIASQLKTFLATMNFYRKFIPHAIKNQMILQSLIVGNVKNDKREVAWTPESEIAFVKCKEDLANCAMLAYPVHNAQISLHVDASDKAIGAALHQHIAGQFQPLGFFSKKLTATEQRYSTYDRELLAMYRGVQHFDYMLEGRTSIIYTDHKPLTFAFSQSPSKTTSPRRARHLDYISQYTTDIRHVKGAENHTADFLSRIESISSDWSYDDIANDQAQDEELQNILSSSTTSLKLKLTPLPNSTNRIYCDITNTAIRPFVTRKFRRAVIERFHSVSHPGIRATHKLIKDRFVWPNIHRDCSHFVKHCVACQKCKVHKHTKSLFGTPLPPNSRFDHVNIDIVGPLPPSHGHRYILTAIDRFSRWPECYPMEDMTADTVASVFVSGWIARFGAPLRITSDLGRQFESTLFAELNRLMGVQHIRTTPRHPQSNGVIERMHRTLKAAITCREQADWYVQLPIVLLGLRTAFKADLQASPAELLYGTQLRLPGEFFVESPKEYTTEFADTLRKNMRELKPSSTAHHTTNQPIYEHTDLRVSSHVFVSADVVKPPLTPAYSGPYAVKKRYDKYFLIDINGRPSKISVDRLRPAHIFADEPIIANRSVSPPVVENASPTPSPVITRAGRRVRLPDRFIPG